MKKAKVHTLVFNAGDEYGPGYWEIFVEGESFGGGAARVVGFYDDVPEALEILLKEYPKARVVR